MDEWAENMEKLMHGQQVRRTISNVTLPAVTPCPICGSLTRSRSVYNEGGFVYSVTRCAECGTSLYGMNEAWKEQRGE